MSIVIVCAPVFLYVGLCVFSLPTLIVMIEKIYILRLIIIIKSEVWIITHCLGLGHETMVYAVCLSIFLYNVSPILCCVVLFFSVSFSFLFFVLCIWLFQLTSKCHNFNSHIFMLWWYAFMNQAEAYLIEMLDVIYTCFFFKGRMP